MILWVSCKTRVDQRKVGEWVILWVSCKTRVDQRKVGEWVILCHLSHAKPGLISERWVSG